jgi:hypothetical protein
MENGAEFWLSKYVRIMISDIMPKRTIKTPTVKNMALKIGNGVSTKSFSPVNLKYPATPKVKKLIKNDKIPTPPKK